MLLLFDQLILLMVLFSFLKTISERLYSNKDLFLLILSIFLLALLYQFNTIDIFKIKLFLIFYINFFKSSKNIKIHQIIYKIFLIRKFEFLTKLPI